MNVNKYRDMDVSDPGWFGLRIAIILIAVLVWVYWTTMRPGAIAKSEERRKRRKKRRKRKKNQRRQAALRSRREALQREAERSGEAVG